MSMLWYKADSGLSKLFGRVMHTRAKRKKKKKIDPNSMEEIHSPVVLRKRNNKTNNGFYKSGPMRAIQNALGGDDEMLQSVKTRPTDKMREEMPLTIAPIKGRGKPVTVTAKASSVTLEGETNADFSGSFSTERMRLTPAEGCDACAEDDPCVRARGTLVARYRVTTTVTLPSVDDFPDLTPCQRERVQNAIDTVLAPHEQEHVRAFRQYNGVVRTPFDVTVCRSEVDSTVQDIFDRQDSARQDSARAASAALDPFSFTVDLDCDDEPSDDAAADTPPVHDEAPIAGDDSEIEEPQAPVEESIAPEAEAESEAK